MANNPYPRKNTAFTFDVALVDQANRPSFKASPTLATGDAKVSIDGGAFANLTTLPTVTPAAGRAVLVSLSAAEMNGDLIVVQLVDAAGAEWDDLLVTMETSASAYLTSGTGTDQLSVSGGRGQADVAYWDGSILLDPNVSGVPLVDVGYFRGTASAGTAGYAGPDWSHVNAPTTTVALTGTTIASTQQVDLNTIKTQSVTCAAGVTVGAHVGNATAALAVSASGYVTLAPAGLDQVNVYTDSGSGFSINARQALAGTFVLRGPTSGWSSTPPYTAAVAAPSVAAAGTPGWSITASASGNLTASTYTPPA